MNQMISNGVNSQPFVCSTLERIEHFYTVILGLRVVKRTISHLDARLPVITFGFNSLAEEPRSQTITYLEWNPMFYMMPKEGITDAALVADAVSHPSTGHPKGRWGTDTNHQLALHVPSQNAFRKCK